MGQLTYGLVLNISYLCIVKGFTHTHRMSYSWEHLLVGQMKNVSFGGIQQILIFSILSEMYEEH